MNKSGMAKTASLDVTLNGNYETKSFDCTCTKKISNDLQ